ncbi:ABC transporter ATP-binding protein [Amycolatopsis sp. SID8362]|uniref:dipeptide ABC transporter ATP-binding protein n=1 Tax=Amycolatopsis sp. SID8362 TaxID=2690346 RepID=UPI001370B857|nr:ABC transporter ATP-binding protein [Amycolatopsis sp. SID8362]NBH01668.1 dipeptide ABC transporter ATP-binding protein [Amycolatopsis sp. SID8362]NED38369.1 ABC transporter ATP-binding protein [Amycolatopsis sp. SID8362]
MTLLRISDLAVSYRGVPAVRDVGFDVGAGEVVAVVGESGSGKSTTAHAAIGLLPRGGRVDGGSITFDGRDLLSLSSRQWRSVRGREIALVPQDPAVSLNPVHRIGDQVAEVLKIHGLADRRTASLEAISLLERAGVPSPSLRARQYPHQLSGGLRQRVLIAAALAGQPKLIIADEPTSALDVTVQRRILDHLTSLAAESGTAILLITHDLGVAADRASRIVVLSEGSVVEEGPSVVSAPTHPYTRQLIAAAPSLSSPSRPPAPAAEPLVSVRDLAKTFDGGIRAVDGVSFDIPRGQTLALVGESGSGKSTTARMVLRLETPSAGSISFDGQDITTLSGPELRRLRRRMQIVYQNPYASLNPKFSIEDVVAEPLRAFGLPRTSVPSLLDQVALPSSVARRKPSELSGGQRQRVAIARALALRPDLVVCDEPVSALDVSVQAQILALLAELQSSLGLTYLFISHDLAVVRQLADQVGVMREGVLVELGPAARVLEEPEAEYTKELLAAIPGRSVQEVG